MLVLASLNPGDFLFRATPPREITGADFAGDGELDSRTRKKRATVFFLGGVVGSQLILYTTFCSPTLGVAIGRETWHSSESARLITSLLQLGWLLHFLWVTQRASDDPTADKLGSHLRRVFQANMRI